MSESALDVLVSLSQGVTALNARAELAQLHAQAAELRDQVRINQHAVSMLLEAAGVPTYNPTDAAIRIDTLRAQAARVEAAEKAVREARIAFAAYKALNGVLEEENADMKRIIRSKNELIEHLVDELLHLIGAREGRRR